MDELPCFCRGSSVQSSVLRLCSAVGQHDLWSHACDPMVPGASLLIIYDEKISSWYISSISKVNFCLRVWMVFGFSRDFFSLVSCFPRSGCIVYASPHASTTVTIGRVIIYGGGLPLNSFSVTSDSSLQGCFTWLYLLIQGASGVLSPLNSSLYFLTLGMMCNV